MPEGMRPEKLGRVAIVGMGLIGGSMGAALKRRHASDWVLGIDTDPESVRAAVEFEAADEAVSDLSAVKGADLVVLAVPVHSIPAVLSGIGPYLEPGMVLTDVASVKGEVSRNIAACLPPGVRYVGGHPMAGSEKKGMTSADPYLFENAVYVICANEGDKDDSAVKKVRSLVAWVGAQEVFLSAELHDLLVAHVSHLPHLIAAALVLSASSLKEEGAWRLAAGGFRDMTRIAAGDPALWTGICGTNREALKAAFVEFQGKLAIIEDWLESNTPETLEEFFNTARKLRASLPAKGGLLPEIHDIIVAIPDKPGEIGRVCVILGEHGINIADLGILHVREGEGGTLRVVFYSSDAVQKAYNVLTRAGYRVFGFRER